MSIYGNSLCAQQNCEIPCCNSYGTCTYQSLNESTNLCLHYYSVAWWVWLLIFIGISIVIIISAFLIYICNRNRQRKRLETLIINQPGGKTIYDNDKQTRFFNKDYIPYVRQIHTRNNTITTVGHANQIRQNLGLNSVSAQKNCNMINIEDQIPVGESLQQQKQKKRNLTALN